MAKKKIIGVGSPLVDILARVDHEHMANVPGDKGGMVMVEIDHLNQLVADAGGTQEIVPGGSASNTILGLLKLGSEGSFLGKIGQDERGKFFRDSLVNAGGSDHALKECKQHATGACLSLITPDAERTMRPHLGAAANLAHVEIDEKDFASHDHVHLEGYLLFNRPLAEHVMKTAKAAGCTISLDLASFEVVGANQDVLPQLLTDYVDMVFANEDEAKAFIGEDSPEKALAAFSQHCDTVAIKLGADGAHIQHKGEKVFVDAHKVDAIDTTGAGDLWASGFLYGLLHDLGTENAARLGAAVGAEVVQVIGASIPDHGWLRIRATLDDLQSGK